MKKQLLLLVLTLLPMVAMADDSGACGDNLTWTFTESTGTLTISGTGVMYNYQSSPGYITTPWFYISKKIKTIVLDEGVESTGEFSFAFCSECELAVLPHSLTDISAYSFLNCSSLRSITIPDKVINVGNFAFSDCISLTSISIPASVKSIGQMAFADCTQLVSINVDKDNPIYDSRDNCNAIIGTNSNTLIAGCRNTIMPNSVTNIRSCAFWGCTGLTEITIPSNATIIEEAVFYGCSGLTSIDIPDGVLEIYNAAFSGCSGLTSVTIPDNVTNIHPGAFEDCSAMSTLSIGRGVNWISSGAFQNCMSLTDVYCYAEYFPSTNVEAFLGTPIEHAVLNVPSIHINSYRSTPPWASFKYIFPIEGAHGERCAKPTISQKDGKVVFSCETEGATYVSEVKPLNGTQTNNNELTLPSLYRITVYAQKYGYLDSPAATADVEMSLGKRGDVNQDGAVTITDAVSVVNIILNNGGASAPALENPAVEAPEVCEPE